MESYLLQSNIALAFFFLLYRVIVLYENNQQSKRFIGLGIVIFCSCFLLMPSLEVASPKDFPFVVQEALESANSVQATLSYVPQKGASIWPIIYSIGVGIFTLRFLVGLFGILRLYIKSEVSKKWGFVLVETDTSISPFSFFHLLFIKKEDVEKPGLDPIILHEQYHRDQLHSVDAILLEILTILFWFNPFMWLLQKDIKASHEFMADDYVINNGFDKLAYQDLLFEARTGISFKSANYLSNQTSLKQRFNMMEKRKTHSKTSYLRAGTVLVAMALTVFITSFSGITDSIIGTSPNIQIFTVDGVVDIKKGIAKNTSQLYVRMIPKEGVDMKYRVTKTEVTLIVGGRGVSSYESGESIVLERFLSTIQSAEEDGVILLEVKEYQTMNSEQIVETVKPEELISFKIPLN